MRAYTFSIAAAVMALISIPASAATLQFFEGNNCTQKKLGAIDTSTATDSPVVAASILGWNDEARSARVTSHWRTTREPRRVVLWVCDEKRYGLCEIDDRARVTIYDATLIPPEGVCIRSFERSISRNGVRVEYYPKNGLDGKISAIRRECDAACFRNLTPMTTRMRRGQ